MYVAYTFYHQAVLLVPVRCALPPYSCGIQITLINVLLQDSLSPSEVIFFLLAQTAPLFEAHNIDIVMLSHHG